MRLADATMRHREVPFISMELSNVPSAPMGRRSVAPRAIRAHKVTFSLTMGRSASSYAQALDQALGQALDQALTRSSRMSLRSYSLTSFAAWTLRPGCSRFGALCWKPDQHMAIALVPRDGLNSYQKFMRTSMPREASAR